MTFSMGLTDRLDNLRLHRTNTSSSNDDPAFTFYNPTPRITSSRPVSQSSAFDTRNGLQRRFTTQSVSTLSSLSTLGGQRRSVIETNGNHDSVCEHICLSMWKRENKWPRWSLAACHCCGCCFVLAHPGKYHFR